MSDIDEDEIKRRAYEIWEAEGRPEGSHDVHWAQAMEQLRRESGSAAGNKVKSPSKSAPLSVVAGGTPTTRKRGKIA